MYYDPRELAQRPMYRVFVYLRKELSKAQIQQNRVRELWVRNFLIRLIHLHGFVDEQGI